MASVGPRQVFGVEIVTRGLCGFVGGMLAAIFAAAAIFGGGPILMNFTNNDTKHPLIIISILIVLFIITIISNVLSTLLMGLTNKKKYINTAQAIGQVLMANVVTFVLLLPVYIVAASMKFDLLTYLVALHIMFAILFSSLVFEVMATRTNQFLIVIYSSIISFLIALVLSLLFFVIAQVKTTAILMVPIAPIVTWVSIGIFGTLIEFFYYRIYTLFGVDFLNVDVYNKNEQFEDLRSPPAL